MPAELRSASLAHPVARDRRSERAREAAAEAAGTWARLDARWRTILADLHARAPERAERAGIPSRYEPLPPWLSVPADPATRPVIIAERLETVSATERNALLASEAASPEDFEPVPERPEDAAHYVRDLAAAGYFEAISFTADSTGSCRQLSRKPPPSSKPYGSRARMVARSKRNPSTCICCTQ